jgi:hypothetical protein
MLRHVLRNHLATTALSCEDALNVILELFCALCALFYADKQLQSHTPMPAALQFAHALRRLLKAASGTHQLHRVACISIVRALLADVLARVLFTMLGYTVEEAEQVVEEQIAPALMTYLVSHGSRLARARGHELSC